MIYIQTIESISHQNSFQQENIWDTLSPIETDSTVISPDYKNYISPASLRRLSPVLRMALAAAKECQSTVNDEIDSISVGTALGCLVDTEKFLVTFHTSTSDTLSPTAFIQSTHNTIAGQISLELKNHSYNMTHTQNSLSFELALLDALMCTKEGKSMVLLGAADEAIDFLKLLQPTLINSELQLTSGATFMVISPKKEKEAIGIVDCSMHFETENRASLVHQLLQKNGLSLLDIDQIFVSGDELSAEYPGSIDYLQYTGLYFTAVAFAVHMGHDWLKQTQKKFVLIINEQEKGKLGLILMKRDEASH
jgi:3-oxoacyl-[acyl-carrier-protein] synthase II